MKVPLLDLHQQLKSIETSLKQRVLEVIDSCAYVMGPSVGELEREISSLVGAKHAIGVSSGTDALLVCLMALDVGAGDLVITTPYSFFATAGVVERLGAKPVFVDIDPNTFNIDPSKLADWFQKHRESVSNVKAIIPVHLFGQCADMNPIMELAARYKVPVIEDAAQAIGSRYPSKTGIQQAGTIGSFGCFSFFPTKNLGGIGDGGMVVTNDDALAEKVAALRVHGAKPKYYHSMLGGNFRLDTIQAAALLAKLPHLEAWTTKRQHNARRYDELFTNSWVTTPKLAYERQFHCYNQYVITAGSKRDALRTYLTEQGIGTEIYYPLPLHLQECFRHHHYAPGAFPHSELAAQSILALPIYPELTDEMISYVAKKIIEFGERSSTR